MLPTDCFDAFQHTLITGGYNLLLGSGTSLDSINGLGEPLLSAENLRLHLCSVKGARDSTTLHRVYSLLTSEERKVHLTTRFSKCRPGSSLTPLPNFLWRRLFTFNIDDVFESVYLHATETKQQLIPLNFDAPFEPTPLRTELLAIHLHGWVCAPDSGYVFSYPEYARAMRTMNPWMHVLSEILATESFIIAGTSLNEVDLEYYLSHRSEATPRRSRGPSLLIEPDPDVATEADCKRFGLTLVKATFGQFLDWLQQRFPHPPTLADLVIPDVGALFPDRTISPQLLRFFSDFRLVTAADSPRSEIPSAFLYGKAAQPEDLDQHLDIPRSDTGPIEAAVGDMIRNVRNDAPKLLIVLGSVGTGKSTELARVGHDLARTGQAVLVLRTLSRIDVEAAIQSIESASSTLVLLVDGIADHAEQLVEIIGDSRTTGKLVVVGADRNYRKEFVDLILADVRQITYPLHELNQAELRQLIGLFQQYGLIALADAIKNPDGYANCLKHDPVAIAVCRILNDFRPLDGIIESLWSDTLASLRLPYLCAALSRRCHTAGIRYSILQSASGIHTRLADLFVDNEPLALTENLEDDEYVLPLNSVIAELVLDRAASRERPLMFEAFRKIADALAPHVNRTAIMRRSPEARLAGRLFDADKIVKPLLGERAEQFYVLSQTEWKWNSRYWEQRALLAAESDLDTGVRYARHAVAIEQHPFPLTTLGKLLLRKMEVDVAGRVNAFNEAVEKLSLAIRVESSRSRINVHPYMTLLSGARHFIELGGTLTSQQRTTIRQHSADARYMFPRDAQLRLALDRVDSLL